jgi:hypothetical protein
MADRCPDELRITTGRVHEPEPVVLRAFAEHLGASRPFSRRSSSSVGSSAARNAIRAPSGDHADEATDRFRTTSAVTSPPSVLS